MMENKKKNIKWFGLNRLLPYLKPYRRVLLFMVLFGLVGSLGDILIPLMQRYAIDEYIARSTLSGIGIFAAAYICILLMQVSANYITFRLACKVETNVGRDLKKASFDHLQTLSFSYFNQNSVGYIHARVMSDTDRIGGLVSWNLMDGIWNLAYIAGSAIVMFSIRWQLALLVMTIVPITAVISVYFQRKLIQYNRSVREINSRITGNFNEGITGAETVKTLVVEGKMQRKFDRDAVDMKTKAVQLGHFDALFYSIVSFSASIALALVLWRGGIISLQGVMEIGTLSAFASYAMGLMEPVRWLVSALSSLITVQVNIERFTGLMDTGSDVSDTPRVIAKYGDTFSPKRENWEPLEGHIRFDDVTFKYPDGEEYILEHFDLDVPAGTNVAIVGETGAGKSTLVNLVCRFFEPTSGRVLIDGRDARERSQLWLHSNIGYVLQTPHLFSGTVRENLLYGNPEATEEQMDAAVRAVCADRIIERLEQGYDTDVGEGGDLLSTGEKQLISFARALLADPRIFVLDEATSSIDTVTEQLIQSATERVMRGRTSFVVAHRLSTIRNADVILVVSNGKIIERGTHQSLMSARGEYYTLYTRQFEQDNVRSSFEKINESKGEN